ncbi:MAG: hypothetical protein HYZ00_11240 [Candidatus Hydrogenedentes bacterium]|nr:hypothetical protein [Candidatus Hydrogenedentota bacterium]
MAKQNTVKRPVTQDDIDRCLARAIAEGDIVDFRFLFVPFSPLRADSTEDLQSDKYAYLRPRDEDNALFRDAMRLVSQGKLQRFVQGELEKKGPPQLPSELVFRLADNALRLEKYTAAAQAYELLRVRRRMQEELFRQADEALDRNEIPRAVHGYVAATGLEYDYAAFPEPMPAVPNFQTRALLLHAEYPHRPEDSLPLQAAETQITTALGYLLLSAEAATRLQPRPLEQRLAFIKELVRRRDPDWKQFRERYAQACALVRQFGERLERMARDASAGGKSTLENEIRSQQEQQDPRQVSATLLGREIPNGEWWQYLKDLAYAHPAAVMFVSRQAISKDLEIIMPRYRQDSPLVQTLELIVA